MSSSNKNEIRKGTPIVFGDGVERVVYPISLRGLRKLMVVMKAMDELQAEAQAKAIAEKGENAALSLGDQMSDANIDLMVDAAEIILSYVDPDAAKTRDDVEDIVDIHSFNTLLSAAMGADPNV